MSRTINKDHLSPTLSSTKLIGQWDRKRGLFHLGMSFILITCNYKVKCRIKYYLNFASEMDILGKGGATALRISINKCIQTFDKRRNRIMLLIREVFTGKPGQASKLAKLLKKASGDDANVR
jgi:hypothetical protein